MRRGGAHRAVLPAPTPVRVARTIRDLLIVVVAALALSFLLKQVLVQTFSIPSGSMAQTLEEGDRVLVSKLAPGPLAVHRGDIVVFKDPGEWLSPPPAANRSIVGEVWHAFLQGVGLAPPDDDQFLIKRVIGMGGDTVECQVAGAGQAGALSVNGEVLSEPYLAEGAMPCTEQLSVTVPDGAVWVMGDNRQGSMDSRYHRGGESDGAVDMDLVVGVAKVRLAPFTKLSRLALLRNPGATFVDVPHPGLAEL